MRACIDEDPDEIILANSDKLQPLGTFAKLKSLCARVVDFIDPAEGDGFLNFSHGICKMLV